MSNISKTNISRTRSNNKTPNLKEFIKYLDQTVQMFDQHISEEEYENKNSDVYKLFVTLFNIYTDLDTKKSKGTGNLFSLKDHPHEIWKTFKDKNNNLTEKHGYHSNNIIKQHIDNKKIQTNNPKWENNRSINDSEKMAKEMYKKSLLELYSAEPDGPILFNDANDNKNILSSVAFPKINLEKSNKLLPKNIGKNKKQMHTFQSNNQINIDDSNTKHPKNNGLNEKNDKPNKKNDIPNKKNNKSDRKNNKPDRKNYKPNKDRKSNKKKYYASYYSDSPNESELSDSDNFIISNDESINSISSNRSNSSNMSDSLNNGSDIYTEYDNNKNDKSDFIIHVTPYETFQNYQKKSKKNSPIYNPKKYKQTPKSDKINKYKPITKNSQIKGNQTKNEYENENTDEIDNKISTLKKILNKRPKIIENKYA
jgi:hypothetical protein